MAREYVIEPFNAGASIPAIDYESELNAQQLAAVTAPAGTSLVIAGAGSGKTRVLTYRVAYLLEQGIAPERILLMTFTNKSAREMMRRVGELLQRDTLNLWGGTFHSIGNRILRRFADRVGLRPDFTILDREDAVDLMKTVVGELAPDAPKERFPKSDVIADILSMSINTGQTIRQVIDRQHRAFISSTELIEKIAAGYAARKTASSVVDFDDLLALWLRLMQEHPDVTSQLQERFQFILVDEYQDTNTLQNSVIELLAARHGNLMVVGDDSQSIYSWRGANFQNIIDFPQRHPGTHFFKIETNYRSTPQILSVANAAISLNDRQFPKELSANRRAGTKPALVSCGDAAQQAAFVAQRALELREEGMSLNDMAVLYRSHFHAMELQMELARRNIPMNLTSGVRFFEQAHVKDVAAHLKLVVNPLDELAFKRLVRLQPGVGEKAAEKLWSIFRPRAEKLSSERAPNALATAFQACASAAPKKAAAGWANLAATFAELESPKTAGKPSEMIRIILEAFYEDYLEETFANAPQRQEDIEQMARFSEQFPNLVEFLTQLALVAGGETESTSETPNDEAINLLTIHQSKGMEYRVVFVIMLCEGLFPSFRSLEDPDAMEEERRLFYVAVTRAKEELHLSYPLLRFMRGSMDAMQQPSRFLAEIPHALVDEWNLVTQANHWR